MNIPKTKHPRIQQSRTPCETSTLFPLIRWQEWEQFVVMLALHRIYVFPFLGPGGWHELIGAADGSQHKRPVAEGSSVWATLSASVLSLVSLLKRLNLNLCLFPCYLFLGSLVRAVSFTFLLFLHPVFSRCKLQTGAFQWCVGGQKFWQGRIWPSEVVYETRGWTNWRTCKPMLQEKVMSYPSAPITGKVKEEFLGSWLSL